MNKSQVPNVSVVIPSFGCAGSLQELTKRLFALEHELGAMEVIIVDDESDDGSWQITSDLAKIHHNLIPIRLPRNRGQHYAVAKGVGHSSGRFVATIDCDLEFDPEIVPQMIAKLEDSIDCVIAKAPLPENSGLTRRFFRRVYHTVLASITRNETLNSEALAYNFLVARGDVLRNIFRGFPASDPISTKLIASDARLTSHPVVRNYRRGGSSRYTLAENLHVASGSILSSGRGGEIFAIRTTIFVAVGSLFAGLSWVFLGLLDRDSWLRDLTFLVALLMFVMLTISSALVLAVHIMTSVLGELRIMKIDKFN